jgi:hypothetical protein
VHRIRAGELGVAGVPDRRGGFGIEGLLMSKVALQLKVCPVVERVADQRGTVLAQARKVR